MKKLTKKGEVLVLKVVGPNGESYGKFVWPLEVGAVVEAPDWDPAASCGNGLHGWLWGLGDLSAAGFVSAVIVGAKNGTELAPPVQNDNNPFGGDAA